MRRAGGGFNFGRQLGGALRSGRTFWRRGLVKRENKLRVMGRWRRGIEGLQREQQKSVVELGPPSFLVRVRTAADVLRNRRADVHGGRDSRWGRRKCD